MRIILLTGALLCAPALHAQAVELYGTVSVPRISGAPTGSGTQTSSYWAPGIGGGATFNVVPIGPVRLGLDLRGSTKPTANGISTVLAGAKLALKIPAVSLKPYVEAAGGYLGTNTHLGSPFAPGSTHKTTYAGYEVLAGADSPLAPFLNLRILEVGAGKGYQASGPGSSTITLFTLSSGLVFHF
jgi:hypothetical protein